MNIYCKQLKLQSQSGNVRHGCRLENDEEAGEKNVRVRCFMLIVARSERHFDVLRMNNHFTHFIPREYRPFVLGHPVIFDCISEYCETDSQVNPLLVSRWPVWQKRGNFLSLRRWSSKRGDMAPYTIYARSFRLSIIFNSMRIDQ